MNSAFYHNINKFELKLRTVFYVVQGTLQKQMLSKCFQNLPELTALIIPWPTMPKSHEGLTLEYDL